MKKIAFFFICMIGLTANATADESIYQKSGNIYFYSKSKNHIVQLTKSFHDSDPVLSPNAHWVVFLRNARFKIPKKCTSYYNPSDRYGKEIWIYDFKQMKERLLVANNFSCDHLTGVIIDPTDLKFSPNSKTLYFETSAWDTSGAIHRVDVNGKDLRFVTNGNEYRVVMDGKYKGDLIINQHRYHRHGSSYDWDWLFTPTGRQIKLYRKEN